MENDNLRLSKLMTLRGICSRREADRYIEAGWVRVDGQKAILGMKVSPDVQIELSQQAQTVQEQKVTILLNKPLGYVSSQPEDGYPEALDLLTPENCFDEHSDLVPGRKIGVAGRLDIDSKGLLVYSEDGIVIKELIGPDSVVEKEYLVRVHGDVSEVKIKKLRFGISLDGKPLKRAQVDLLGPGFFRFVLLEGKKRQIRRMCEEVGLEVISLKRVRIGKFKLGNLPEGKWRIWY